MKILFAILVALLFFSFSPVNAQSLINNSLESQPTQVENISTCDQHYNQRINLNFVAKKVPKSFIPGQIFKLSGSLQNIGPLIVGDGYLYAVVKKGDYSSSKNKNQSDAVEYFELAKNIDLPTGGHLDINYEWSVPSNLPKGKYHIEFRLVYGGKIVLPVNFVNQNFEVKEGVTELPVSLVKSSLSSKDGRKSLLLSFTNKSELKRTVPVTVKIYSGSEINGNPIETITKNIEIDGGSTKSNEILFSDYPLPKKLIVIQYAPDIIGKSMRFIVDQSLAKGSPILYAGGLSKTKGEIGAFACILPTNFGNITKLKSVITLLDSKNTEIKKVTKEIISTSTAMVTSSKFNKKDIANISGNIKVVVDTYVGNSLVDKSLFSYSCENENLKESLCGGNGGDFDLASFYAKYKKIIYSIIGMALFLWLLSLVGYKKIINSFNAVFLIGLFLTLSFSFTPHIAFAQWRSTIKDLIYSAGNYTPASLETQLGELATTWYYRYWYDSDPNGGYWGQMAERHGFAYSKGNDNTTVDKPQGSVPGKLGPEPYDIRDIQIPLWYGFYIIDPGVQPVDESTEGPPLSFYESEGHYWGQNVAYGQASTSDATWRIPVGTKIGFYFSGKQVKPYPKNNLFSWGARYHWEGQFLARLGEYAETLPSNSLASCFNDRTWSGSYGDYLSSYNDSPLGTIATRNSPQCSQGFSNYNRHFAMRIKSPQFSVSGLNNFSCEPLQSDGTMECVASTPGESIPTVNVHGIEGRIYGATLYRTIQTGAFGHGSGKYAPGETVLAPQYTSIGSYMPDSGPMSVFPVDPLYKGYSLHDRLYADSNPAVLGDGQPGFILEPVNFRPFGKIIVGTPSTPPTSPVVDLIGSPWAASGGTDYLFSAVSSDSDPDDGLVYQIDWNNDGSSDLETHFIDTYRTSTSASVAQPGYFGSSLFAWDSNSWYALPDSSLRFNAHYTTSGTKSFRVRAVDRYNNASGWTTKTVTVVPPPTSPSNFFATAGSCGSGVALSWTGVSGVVGYKLYKYNNISGEDDLIATLPIGTTSYNDTTAVAPMSPLYKLSSYSASGESPMVSSNVVAAPAACSQPLPPSSLTATTGSCGGRIVLNWTVGTGATAYYIERLEFSTWTRIATVFPSTQTTYTDTPGISVNRTYRIQSYNSVYNLVSDYNQFPASADSSAACNPSLPPSGPIGSAVSACGGRINFSWSNTGGNGATSYRLYRDNGGTYGLVATIPVSSTSYFYHELNTAAAIYVMSGYNSGTLEESSFVLVNGGTPIQASSACPPVTQCSDDIDNDGNGYFDFDGNSSGNLLDNVPRGASIYANCISLEDNLEAPAFCLRGTVSGTVGQTHTFYSTTLGATAAACSASSKVLVCGSNGLWADAVSGNNYNNYRYDYCRINAKVIER